MQYVIRGKRIEKKISQEELSRRSGVSRATISKLESGEKVEVKINTLEAIANSLECNVSDLFLQ